MSADLLSTHSGALVGRESELALLAELIAKGRHALLEGPVGVGKTHLVTQALQRIDRAWVRIDGDGRYSEQKLTGFFDPPLVMQAGYRPEHFVPGPLVTAMQHGQVLFVNELNRMPEGVQNVLLPAMDERTVHVPRYGTVTAKPGFSIIATQNPSEYVATQRLSEALLDRFEAVVMGYQTREEEEGILQAHATAKPAAESVAFTLDLIAATRADEQTFQRGASIRAGLALVELLGERAVSELPTEQLERYTASALRTRVALSETAETTLEGWIARFVKKNPIGTSPRA